MVHYRQKMFPDSFCIGSSQSSGFILLSLVSKLAMDIPPCSCALPIIIIVLPPSCLPPQAETRDGRGRREGAGGNGVERGRQTDRSGGKEGRKEGSVNRVIYFPLSSILNKSGQLWSDVRSAKSRMEGIRVRGLSADPVVHCGGRVGLV